ncbi:MAG: hypothetical protein ACKOOI_21895 [Pirellula sp.]
MTVELTNDPTVDEKLTNLTSSFGVVIVTIMRLGSMPQVQGCPVSAKEEEVIIA